MGENGDEQAPGAGPPGDGIDEFTAPAAVERRVWRNIYVVSALAIFTSAIFGDLRFLLGMMGGCGLAVLNYHWLHASLRAILESGSATAPPGTALKFVFRWVVIGAAVYVANWTGYFNPLAMLAGLFTPAVAVIVEAVYSTVKTLVQDGER